MSAQNSPEKQRQEAYRKSLNLPATDFPMRANLVENEPRIQERWEHIELLKQLEQAVAPNGSFVFHDGPPYANGPIHLGHMLNKVLKDLVVRSRTMAGQKTKFIPGWDCHGLPIEHKVQKELGPKAKSMNRLEIRALCKAYAEKYVALQASQMQRLGTIGTYDEPYLTMDPAYEAAVLEVFARLVEEGAVYRALKPVHWSIANRTALAEAELEYEEREDTSVYVLFEILQGEKLPASLRVPEGETAHLMIWTTTPWTLPANLAVAVSPLGEYALYKVAKADRTFYAILVRELGEKVLQAGGASQFELLGTCSGNALVESGVSYAHPFANRTGPVLAADYVTFEDGTGLVHTAPGHGEEDYHTGLKAGLDVYCPVLADGTFDDTVPDWLAGQDVWQGNDTVCDKLQESGHLFYKHRFSHSYPHDWRSKTPTIFRATQQWFVGVDTPLSTSGKSLRELAIQSCHERIRFLPEWGRSRLLGMLEARPDWCISRQRAWGLPIPAFLHPNGGSLLTPASVRAVAQVIRQHGSDYWFDASASELLAHYDPSQDTQAPSWLKRREDVHELEKGTDIFDVWFESGSSWHAVLRERQVGYPADLYLEGSDQHRGWFQLSLLPALGATGQPPFKSVLTHGFMVDANGRKMSKSQGNAIDVADLLKKYGADICRWWVAGLNSANDIKVDWQFFKVASEEYRKVRNTLRFLLGNLSDFNPQEDTHRFGPDDAHSLDAWVLHELCSLVDTVTTAYHGFQFRRAREALFHFCNETLSAVYMAATKDRLYCEASNSPRRRRTQTALYEIAETLLRLLAPILVHTAEEAFTYLPARDGASKKASVHLLAAPQPEAKPCAEGWSTVMELRHEALKALEDAKASLGVNNPLDAGIYATLPAAEHAAIAPFTAELADLCGVSQFHVELGDGRDIRVVDLRHLPRCERSWRRDGTVQERTDGGMLSDRDAAVLAV